MNGNPEVLRVSNLVKHFQVGRALSFGLDSKRETVKAVDGIGFNIAQGEILGLAGESGSGKSTTGELIVRLLSPDSGRLLLDGHDISTLRRGQMKQFRTQVQMIFQDPYGTLNPRLTVRATLEEPLIINGDRNSNHRLERIKQTLERAELAPWEKYLHRRPSELSGGERQRVAIARTLVLEPRLLVADEPVSMLDVSIRAGILNLLKRLRDELGLAMLYISHDLSTIRYLCDRTAIMYMGKIVEIGRTREVLNHPLHPYTRLLLSAVPVPDPDHHRETAEFIDELPDQIDRGEGCPFVDRCPKRLPHCGEVFPMAATPGPGHEVNCHLYTAGSDRPAGEL